MPELDSLSIFVGTGKCNARCVHCAGLHLRKFAPKADGEIDEELIAGTMAACYEKGARSLTITGCGEPTCSPKAVTKALELAFMLRQRGVVFESTNLYTNGIIVGTNSEFCWEYLPLWGSLGLTDIRLTLHHIDEETNAYYFNVPKYPPVYRVVDRIHRSGLRVRVNLLLNGGAIPTCGEFSKVVRYLQDFLSVSSIATWPLRDAEDNIDMKALPPAEELTKMAAWVEGNPVYRVRFLENEEAHQQSYNRKLTLFPDGTLSNAWCQ
jgi:molybdenum cofactor biosynthesis enzyme MoaA